MKNIINISLIALTTMTLLQSCQQPGKNSTGSEYVPDMAHSVAIESNVSDYYYNNRWGSKDDYHTLVQPRLPVKGTVPRSGGSDVLDESIKGMHSHGGRAIPANGSRPYHYADNDEDRAKAMAEILNNPYPISAAGLAKGKELYVVFCAICHGEKADGAGYLVREDGGKYPVQPANFLLDDHINSSNGRYYHAIYYGRNLMGSYKDKLSYEERWQVIHYIRSLQAAEKKLVYDENQNTFNTTDTPNAIVLAQKAAKMTMDTPGQMMKDTDGAIKGSDEHSMDASDHNKTEHHK